MPEFGVKDNWTRQLMGRQLTRQGNVDFHHENVNTISKLSQMVVISSWVTGTWEIQPIGYEFACFKFYFYL